jgi:hypothetical protein
MSGGGFVKDRRMGRFEACLVKVQAWAVRLTTKGR